MEKTLNSFRELVNGLLDDGREVRIKNDYDVIGTKVYADGVICATFLNIIIYPGYVNCTRAGTPARLTRFEDCGGFDNPRFMLAHAWRCCMSDEYNSYDGDYKEGEGGEDAYLDLMWEDMYGEN